MNTVDSAKQQRVSPKTSQNPPRQGSGRGDSKGRMQPFVAGENDASAGMNSLLKSPIKNNLQHVPIRNNQSGSAKNNIINP